MSNPRAYRGIEGASLVEYVLLVTLVALACFAAIQFFGDARNSSLSRSGSAISGNP